MSNTESTIMELLSKLWSTVGPVAKKLTVDQVVSNGALNGGGIARIVVLGVMIYVVWSIL